MPFAHSHLYLTLHWIPSLYPAESGQAGIRFDNPTGAVTQALVDACKPAVQTFWASAGAAIASAYALRYVRLARIDPDGHYIGSSFDGVYSGSGVNGVGADVGLPAQSACASTLLTGVPHGQASKGRVFLPPLNKSLASPGDFLWTAVDVNARSTALAAMLTSLNGILGGPASVFSKGTVRSAAGTQRPVEAVATGRRPDVQRRRAKGIPDLRGTSSVVTAPAP
jgi:hypothetical protein